MHILTLNQVRSRGLPDDHAGPIRIVDIEGVDANMCCGTHVSNLSHLQVKYVHVNISLPTVINNVSLEVLLYRNNTILKTFR